MRNLTFLAFEFFDREPLPEPAFDWVSIVSAAIFLSVIAVACLVLP